MSGDKIKVVTLDAYGTLFDIDSLMLPAASEIVSVNGLGCTPEALADCWTKEFFALLDSYGSSCRPVFRTVRELTTESLECCLRKLGQRADKHIVEEGVENWFGRVKDAEPYPEVREAVERLAARFKLAVVSDADDEILAPCFKRAGLPVEHVFTSEAVRAYKIEPGGTIFRRVFSVLGCASEEVVHIGDSKADVLGAHRAGSKAVWLSRDGRSWRDDGPVRPWLVARDLAEAAELLLNQ